MVFPRVIGCLLVALAALLLPACQAPYLFGLAGGQLAIFKARQPVDALRDDAATSPALRDRLALVEELLAFAHDELGLPDNGSYRQYVELGRDYPVWNVFSAPEFALELRSWCFPVAGCTTYRGYFSEAKARAFAQRLAEEGADVFVGPAVAYSTLGFFRDPVLSSMTALPDTTMAGLIFHELAHQRFYLAGDTSLSESFAVVVEQEGTLRWLRSRGDHDGLCRHVAMLERRGELYRLFDALREELATIYAEGGADEARREAKAAAFARLRQGHAQLRADWVEPPWFDGWFEGELNNARLGAHATYDEHVGALQEMLADEGGELTAFYRRMDRLGRLAAADRAALLGSPGAGKGPAPGVSCVAASADLEQQASRSAADGEDEQ